MSKFSEMIAEMSDEIHKYIHKCIESASFDKSKSARITQVLDNNEYVVTMSDGAVKTVPSLSSDSFNVNDVVRVTVAQNDSKNCYIIGKPNISKGSSSGSVDSVNGQTGVVVLDADDINDASTTNKFVTSADKTKLSNLSGVNTGDQDISVKADKYVSENTYSAGASVIHNGHLWINTSGSSTVNVEPGTNYNVWNVTYCNQNMLDNWDFRNPVNQRGASSYTGFSIYTIDRWMVGSNQNTVTVNANGVTLTSTSGSNGHWMFFQYIDNFIQYAGKTVTFSIGVSNLSGSFTMILSDGVTDTFKTITSNGSHSITKTISISNTMLRVLLMVSSDEATSFKPIKAKLELGSISTLANDPPADFGAELAKCQRYYYDSSYNNSNLGGSFVSKEFFNSDNMLCNVRFPVQMRTLPSVIIKSVGGTLNAVSDWASTQDSITNCVVNGSTLGRSGFNGILSSGLFNTNSVYAFHVIAVADL